MPGVAAQQVRGATSGRKQNYRFTDFRDRQKRPNRSKVQRTPPCVFPLKRAKRKTVYTVLRESPFARIPLFSE
jgi:hypothetical protein